MRRPALSVAVVVLFVFGRSLVAQDDAKDPLRERGIAMYKAALRDRQSYALLAELTGEAPHRLAGSEGNAAAVAWAAKAFARVGVRDVSLEPVTVPKWVRGDVCEVTMIEGDGAASSLAALALGGSPGTGEDGVTAEVIEVLSLGQLRARGAEVKGKIVLFNRPYDLTATSTGSGYGGAVDQRGSGPAEAAKLGAVAAVVRSVTSEPDDVPHTGATNFPAGGPKIPAIAISVVAAERLATALGKGPVKVRVRVDCRDAGTVESANVVADIKGRERPDEIVLLGAHLDGWDVGHGAHDDGAGTAHVIEAARLVLATGAPPRRTLRFVLFNNEENGLDGAKAYARKHEALLGKHVLAIETDSGGFAPRGFHLGGGKALRDILAPVAATLAALDLGDLRDGGGGADISVLGPAGVPLGLLRVAGDRYFDLHHTEKDVLANVHPRELALGAAALAIMGFGAADLAAELPRVVPAAK